MPWTIDNVDIDGTYTAEEYEGAILAIRAENAWRARQTPPLPALPHDTPQHVVHSYQMVLARLLVNGIHQLWIRRGTSAKQVSAADIGMAYIRANSTIQTQIRSLLGL